MHLSSFFQNKSLSLLEGVNFLIILAVLSCMDTSEDHGKVLNQAATHTGFQHTQSD